MKLRIILSSCLQRIRSSCGSFCRSESGITLPLLAMSMVVITGTVGLAIDTARLQLVQSKLQFSLDAAGLAAGADTNITSVTTDVTNYLNANFNGYMGASISGLTTTLDTTGTIISLTAKATLPTTFLGVVGVTSMSTSASSQITRSQTGLELVMVLDNTGSMTNSAGGSVSKLQALQAAANDMITTLFNGQTTSTNGKLWVGIVPFTQGVNIGTGHPTWMNTTYDATLASTGPGWGPTSWFGCVDARLNGEDVNDDPPQTSNVNTLFDQYYWTSDNLNTDGVYNSGYNKWATPIKKNGVITGYNYTSNLGNLTGGPNYLCPQTVTPMTNNATTLTASINAMTAQGDTLINQGLQWGWNMLSPRWRGLWGGTMNANGLPLAYNTPGMAKALVLVTDGENTIDNVAHGAYWFLGDNRLGTTNSTTAVTDLNNKTLQLCTAMKNAGITIYTIALGTDPSPTGLALLQACATGTNYYFDSPSTTQLQSIFTTIEGSLSSLRVSK